MSALTTDEYYVQYYANCLRYSDLGMNIDEMLDEQTALMMAFFDERVYAGKLKIFEEMRDANEHILTNIAVSLDIPVDEETKDLYEVIRSELYIRKRFETQRGQRL